MVLAAGSGWDSNILGTGFLILHTPTLLTLNKTFAANSGYGASVILVTAS